MSDGNLGPALTYPSPAGASEASFAGVTASVSPVLRAAFVSGRRRGGGSLEPAEEVCRQSTSLRLAVLGATQRGPLCAGSEVRHADV